MARTDQRHPGNVAGDWFVDTRCIDCGTCREIAPLLFTEAHGASVVQRQPDASEQTEAWLAAAPWASDIVTLEQEVQPGLVAIPVPGHTEGSMAFLLDDTWLFTGDSLAWSHERADLTAFRDACWYSWRAQTDSLAELAARHRFAAVLPGHGARHLGDADDVHRRLVNLVDRMRR